MMFRRRWVTKVGALTIVLMVISASGIGLMGMVGGTTENIDARPAALSSMQVNGSVNVTGQLVGPDGVPVANAVVVFESADSDTFKVVTTDDNGRYEATVPAGEGYALTMAERNSSGVFGPRNGVVDVWEFAEITPTEDRDMGTIRLPRGHVVRINVTDTSGQALENASIGIEPRSGSIERSSYSQSTLGGNEFYFSGRNTPGVELSGDYEIIINLSSVEGTFEETRLNKTISVASNQSVEFVAVRGRSVNVTGRLVGPEGAPVANAQVALESADSEVFKVVTTNDDGRYEAGIPAEKGYALTVLERNASGVYGPRNGVVDIWEFAEITPTEDREMGTTRLPRGNVVRIYVTDTSGEALTNASVSIYTLAGSIERSRFFKPTLGGSEFSFFNRDVPGVELSGEYEVVANISSIEGNFEETRLNRTINVTSDRAVELVATRTSDGDGPPPVCPDGSAPTDPDSDGVYEDVTGDGMFDIFDVQCLLDTFGSSEVQNNAAAFDFTGDGNVNIFDVQAALNEV